MQPEPKTNTPVGRAGADAVETTEETEHALPRCPNGHPVPGGTALCPACGTFVAGSVPAPPTGPVLPQVPGYELLQELGRGGMGIVYRARHLRLNRIVAIKMILAGDFATAEARLQFQREAEAVARLQHPNVVQVFEIGEAGGKAFFSLEFVDGASLADRLGGKPLIPLQAARLVRVLAKAVQGAHDQGIVHRDLKPANILIAGSSASPTEQWTPKIADFGLAKRLTDQSHHTQSGAVMGTPSYMAPEQAAGKTKDIGPLCDVYALGAILYEMLTGRPPFKGATTLDTIDQVRTQDPVPPSRLQPKVPRNLETICLMCLRKDPKKRYASAADLADDLERFQKRKPIRARPVSKAEILWLWCVRNPLPATLTALLLFVSSVGFGLVAWKWLEAKESLDKEKIAVRRAAYLAFGQGLNYCDQGKVETGLFWFVHSLELARDDDQLQSSARHQLAFWQTHIPILKKTWKEPSLVSLAAFNPQGTVLFLAREDNTIVGYEVSTGKGCWEYKPTKTVKKWFLDPAGENLLTLSKDNILQLLNVRPGEPPLVHKELDIGSRGLLAVAFRKQDKTPLLAFRTKAGKVAILDWKSALELPADSDWKSEFELPTEAEWEDASFDRQGQHVLIRSQESVECWQLSSKFLKLKVPDLTNIFPAKGAKQAWTPNIARLREQVTRIKDAAISPDGKQVLAAYADGKIQGWICDTRAQLFGDEDSNNSHPNVSKVKFSAQLFGDEDSNNSHPNVSKVKFSSTGELFLSANHENLTLWKANGDRINPLAVSRSVNDDFGFIGTDAKNETTDLFVAGTGSGFRRGRLSTGWSDWSSVPFHGTPKAVHPSGNLAFMADKGNGSLWELAMPSGPDWIETPLPIDAAAFTDDGTGLRILFYQDKKKEKLLEQGWDLKAKKMIGSPVAATQPNAKWIRSKDTSADKRWHVSGDREGLLRFSDLELDKPLGPSVRCGTAIKTVQFHPDAGKVQSEGRKFQVLIVSSQGRVGLFDIPPPTTGATDEIRRHLESATGLKMDDAIGAFDRNQ